MKQTNRFWKFVFATLFATLIVSFVVFFYFWQTLSELQIHTLVALAIDHFLYFVSMGFILLLVAFTGLEIIFLNYIKPIKKIAAEASMIYGSNPSHRLEMTGNRDIRNLSSVINNFAELFENLNKNITQQILVARQETEKERNLLAAIMAELPQGVIICNKNGRILLFNSLAKIIFIPDATSVRPEYFIGLGRSIFHLIDKALIAHALDEIEERLENDRQSVASCFITPIHTDHLISVETIPVLDPERKMTGFILTFQDVTDDIHHYDITHENFLSLKEGLFRHMELIKKVLNPSEYRQVAKTLDGLSRNIEETTDRVLDVIPTKVPLARLFLSDFLSSLKQKIGSLHGIELNIVHQTPNNRMLADAYSFTAALIFLLKHLSDISLENKFTIHTLGDKDRLTLEITWTNQSVKKEEIEALLPRRINALPSLFYVLKQNNALLHVVCRNPGEYHCSQINITTRTEVKTALKVKQRSPIIAGSRPEFYDFDLFKATEENIDLLDKNLKDITYTVFDTETTGLNPDGGDEIISIAAVRIVNNKIVYKDIFEELVDPRREIPMESYKIHGINYEMVTGKRDINTILPVFRQFTSDTVLVGHNIAFDMKMFKIKEKTTHIKFLNPVIDTLLLSAVLHPLHEQHDMESIARRLGVDIIGRHTALGDSIATAEIFLKLIPILNSNGILTLKDAIKASKKTYYARLKY